MSELRRAMWVYLGGAERHASEGYVGISAGGSGGLVRSSGAWSAELLRVMWVYLPHGVGAW